MDPHPNRLETEPSTDAFHGGQKPIRDADDDNSRVDDMPCGFLDTATTLMLPAQPEVEVKGRARRQLVLVRIPRLRRIGRTAGAKGYRASVHARATGTGQKPPD